MRVFYKTRFRFFVFSLSIIISISIIFSFVPVSYGVQKLDNTFGYPVKNHTVIEGFSAATIKYGPAHRGTDFAVQAGQSVYAIADGRVIFSGKVAGKLYVTIDHENGFKSTYSVMATSSVKFGDMLTKASVIGTASGYTTAGSNNAFMLSLRYKGQYVDPMKYLVGDIPIREIALGAIKKKDKNWLDRMRDLEKKSIYEFITSTISNDDFSTITEQQINEFMEWVLSTGVDKLNSGVDKLSNTYSEVKPYLTLIKQTSDQIIKDKFDGLKEKVKEGINKLRDLQSEVVKKLTILFESIKDFSELYVKYFNKALKYGIDIAQWYLEKTLDIYTFIPRLLNDLLFGIYEYSVGYVNTTFKVLDSYYDIDWLMLARESFLPVSCVTGACTTPLKLACDPKAKFAVRSEKEGYKGSGNKVMLVSGLNSKGSPGVLKVDDGKGKQVGQTTNLPWKTLGYDRSDVTYYTYAMPGESFDHLQPNQDLHLSARTMDLQIKQWNRDNPGEILDLISHSLGGSVISMWLAEFYDKNSREYPPLGKIVMYAPPLGGTALATAGAHIDGDPNALALHDDLNSLGLFGDNMFPSNAVSTKQVEENGELENILRDSRALQKVDVYVIADADDLIVTAGSQPLDGAHNIVLDTTTTKFSIIKNKAEYQSIHPFFSHTSITTDEPATAVAQYILEGRKPPCVQVTAAISSIHKAAFIRSVEMTLGRAMRTGADTVNYKDLRDSLSSSSS